MSRYTGAKGLYSLDYLNRAICNMLNIEPTDVYHIELTIHVDDVAKVTIYSYARTDEDKLNRFADIIKHYEVREIK